MTDVAVSIKDVLVTASVGTFGATTGWAIYIAKFPDTPDSVVLVSNAGGRSPNPKFLLDYPSIQCMIRGDRSGYQDAHTKTIAVQDALLGLPGQTINSDIYAAVNMIGGVNWLGFDADNRPLFSLNFDLITHPASGTNRIAL